jgi:histidinol-phosphate/aromatic aminotransferase/cobyric acid decarboxylase-like protein
MIRRIRTQQPIWALNSVSEFAITLLMKFRKEFHDSFKHFRSDRVFMTSCLEREAGIDVKPGVEGPFLLADFCSVTYPDITDALGRERILVKDLSNRFLKGDEKYTLRLAIRPAEDIATLVQALRRVRALALNPEYADAPPHRAP